MSEFRDFHKLFRLDGKVALITGGKANLHNLFIPDSLQA